MSNVALKGSIKINTGAMLKAMYPNTPGWLIALINLVLKIKEMKLW